MTRWQLHQGTHQWARTDQSQQEQHYSIRVRQLPKEQPFVCTNKINNNQDVRLIEQALQDTKSYRGLVIMGVSKDVHQTLLHWLPSKVPEQQSLYYSYVAFKKLPADWRKIATHVWQAVQKKLPAKSIFYLYLPDVKSCTLRYIKWLDQLCTEGSLSRKQTKIVVGIPDVSLPAYKINYQLEFKAVDTQQPILAKEGLRLQLLKWLNQATWLTGLEESADLLLMVEPDLRKLVFNQAATWYKRASNSSSSSSSSSNSNNGNHFLKLAIANASACFEMEEDEEGLWDGEREKRSGQESDTTFDILSARYDFTKEPGGLQPMVNIPPALLQFAQKIRYASHLQTILPSKRYRLLLSGPPGVGKTCLARALAASLDLPFFAPNPASLVNSYIGVSANNVRHMFQSLRAQAASEERPMVLFLDELEAILGSRAEGSGGGEKEYGRMVTSFLAELEGINTDQQDPIILIGATNFPEQLDPAIASRFTDKVHIDLPNQQARIALFENHLQSRQHSLSHGQLEQCAALTDGFSGRDIVQLLDKAAVLSLQAALPQVSTNSTKQCSFSQALQASIGEEALLLTQAHLEQAISQQRQQHQQAQSAPPMMMYT